MALLLTTWGWKSSGGYLYQLGNYSIDIESWDKQRGFMIRNGSPINSLWVEEGDWNKNLAIKFFLTHLGEIAEREKRIYKLLEMK